MPADWARVDERRVSGGMCDGAAKLVLDIHSTSDMPCYYEKHVGESIRPELM